MFRYRFARFILTLALASPIGVGRTSAATFPLSSAPLRSPQVALAAAPLSAYFASVGETISPASDQRSAELFFSSVSNNSTFTIQMELGRYTAGVTLSLYSGYEVNPTPIPVFPETAGPGWFAVCSFRNNPTRVVVNLFDQNAALRGTTTTLGGNKYGIGFVISGPHGTFYSQDARNPDGSAAVLAFAGTGINSGVAWLAFETEPGPTPVPDFADIAMCVNGWSTDVVPVHRTTWGAIKSRFR